MTKLRREKKLIPQEQKGMGDKGRQRFDTWSTAVSEMSPMPTTRPALIFKALSPADSTGPLPSSSACTRRWIPRPAEAGQGTDGRMLEELDVVASAGRRGLLEGRYH